MTEHVSTAYQDVALERTRQDAQWGGAAHDDKHRPDEWLEYIDQQLARAVDRHRSPMFITDPVQVRARLVKIGALAIAAIQAIDRAAVKFENVDV